MMWREERKRNWRKIAAKNKYDKKTMGKKIIQSIEVLYVWTVFECCVYVVHGVRLPSKIDRNCAFLFSIYFELIVVYIWNMNTYDARVRFDAFHKYMYIDTSGTNIANERKKKKRI